MFATIRSAEIRTAESSRSSSNSLACLTDLWPRNARQWENSTTLSTPNWIVATAPLSADGHINCSPKGGDYFRIIGPREVAYLDLTGSGIETVAHVQENGRIVIMFCAFEGSPQIVRLHGTASILYPGDAEFARLSPLFPSHPGARAIVKIAVTRISDSCGYAVPRFNFVEPRDVLDKWTARKSREEVTAYWATKNRHSIDALPGHKHA